MSRPARLIAFSAPSGAGKSTICRKLLERHPEFQLSVSATTRSPRPAERDGVDYFFLSAAEFANRVDAGDFLEHEEVHGNRYGTLRETVERFLAEGKTVLFDIDVNGALAIKAAFPESLLIFIMPPDMEALRARLKDRGSDDDAEIAKRLRRLPMEVEKGRAFDHTVVNDDLMRAVREIETIIEAGG